MREAFEAQVALQTARRVDERVSVHDAEPQPLGVLEAGKFSEGFLLRRPRQARLEADEVISGRRGVLFA